MNTKHIINVVNKYTERINENNQKLVDKLIADTSKRSMTP